MKICWDNLEDFYLSNRGNFRKGRHAYIYKEKCKWCGSPYITLKCEQSDFCSLGCAEVSNLVGERFERLKVKEFAYVKNNKTYWICLCDCGKKTTVSTADLQSKNTRSCGCLRVEYNTKKGKECTAYKHGLAGTKEYRCSAAGKYRATKLNQTPDNANLQKIQLYYTICAYLNSNCEIPMWHVDHIRPISKGGLHHEDNLQILTAAINLQKSAKYPLTEEEQVLYKGVTI